MVHSVVVETKSNTVGDVAMGRQDVEERPYTEHLNGLFWIARH